MSWVEGPLLLSVRSIGIPSTRLLVGADTSRHDAQDLTQGFFLHLSNMGRSAGWTGSKENSGHSCWPAFQNYLSAEAHRAHRLKRGGRCQFVSFDLETAENLYQYEPADYLTPEKIFEARWALTLIEHAMTVLRQEYVCSGKGIGL